MTHLGEEPAVVRAVDGEARPVARAAAPPRAAAAAAAAASAAVGSGARRLLPDALDVPAERAGDGRPIDVAHGRVGRDLRAVVRVVEEQLFRRRRELERRAVGRAAVVERFSGPPP